MGDALVIAAILGPLALGAVSPGPSFLFVSHQAVARSRAQGLAAAFAMGVGALAFAALALVGLRALLLGVPWLYTTLRVLGGLYLVVLGVRLWRGARDPRPRPAGGSAIGGVRNSFLLGLATQLSNPKTALVYASVFATLLPSAPSAGLLMALPPSIFVLETGWYLVVALAFSSGRPRAFYARSKKGVDRVAGTGLAALGLGFALNGIRS